MADDFDAELPPRKKPKISELPLSSAQRSSIDGMLHTFKKKGEFDALRKKAFQQYNESAQRGMFEASLRTFASNEIERDSLKYLRPDRRIAEPLLEGAAARADMYSKTEQDINAYIDQYVANAEQKLREIRRQEIGAEAAEAEMRNGSKSEDAYAAEAEQRRQQRARQHVEDEKKRKKLEAQERKKKQLEELKKKQAALQKETERLQREQKRRSEREAWKAAEKERERERIKKYNEEREKAKKEAEERDKALQEERERRQMERDEREAKRLEAEALEQLLREGQEMTDKSRRPELERSESMEPPARLKHQSAPRTSHGKDQMRAQGLMPTSLTLRKDNEHVLHLQPAPLTAAEDATHLPAAVTDESLYTATLAVSGKHGDLVNAPANVSGPIVRARENVRGNGNGLYAEINDVTDRGNGLLRLVAAKKAKWSNGRLVVGVETRIGPAFVMTAIVGVHRAKATGIARGLAHQHDAESVLEEESEAEVRPVSIVTYLAVALRAAEEPAGEAARTKDLQLRHVHDAGERTNRHRVHAALARMTRAVATGRGTGVATGGLATRTATDQAGERNRTATSPEQAAARAWAMTSVTARGTRDASEVAVVNAAAAAAAAAVEVVDWDREIGTHRHGVVTHGVEIATGRGIGSAVLRESASAREIAIETGMMAEAARRWGSAIGE
ncbi:C-type lectin [Lecanosticta acicola]|uniref:C-type lectin n=1 Tax=Lecanosticta acicola TaxID=111012 RepID=A0AAI8YTM1_9PEZI|nr:C-type lectin [Lecanosticta acicola]